MKFSVVIPTRDRPELLAECLRCLAPGAQSLSPKEYEVIVTDDGVRQPARDLVEGVFPWVRWVEGPRRGPAANRNNGARLGGGRWIAFTDDDCRPAADWLAAFAACLVVKPGAEILEGRTLADPPPRGPFQTAPSNETGGKLWSCNFGICALAFQKLGGFDESFPAAHLEDVDLAFRARNAGLQTEFTPAAVVVHPPRPATPLLRQVMTYESNFYFARKHGISLSTAGLGWYAFMRWCLGEISRSQSPGEFLRYGARCALQAMLLIPLCAWWTLSVRPPPAPCAS